MNQSTERSKSPDGWEWYSVSPILTRYILKEFLKLFGIALLGLLSISLLVEFFEKIDDFIEHHATADIIIEYFIFFIPKVIFYGIPMAILLSTLLTLGILARNSELVAMKSAGVSLYSVAMPILSVAFLVSILSFFFNETLFSPANQRLSYIKDVKIKKKPQNAFFQQNKVWMRGKDNTIINIDLLNPEGENLYGVTIYKFDKRFNLTERVDAKELRWNGEQWIFINGKVRSFPLTGAVNERDFDAIYYDFPERPENLQKVEKKSEEMNIVELYNYIQRLKTAGFNIVKHMVDMHSKISFAFVSFVMALFGIPFSFRGGRSEGIVIGIVASIVIAFFYWIIFSLGISFGKTGMFPPVFAAWVGNLLFGAAGLYMFLNVKQ
ncbi:MAG: LPS export ABC transporter permease LptG [Nitrospirota bacterium]